MAHKAKENNIKREMHKTLINFLLFRVRLLIFIKFHPGSNNLMDRRMLFSVNNKTYFEKFTIQ